MNPANLNQIRTDRYIIHIESENSPDFTFWETQISYIKIYFLISHISYLKSQIYKTKKRLPN